MIASRTGKLQPLPSKREPTADEIFNELNIRYRYCYKFVPKSKDETHICKCNQSDHEHIKNYEKGGDKWDMYHNTVEELNPKHGLLSNGASYSQLALDTPVEKTEKILLNVWKIPKPELVLSIIGGAKYFTLSDRLETNFINSIITVALTSDAWLITNGYNVGIVQLVGQAIYKAKLTKPSKHITAIGICKWGSVKDVKKLINPQQARKQAKRPTTTTDDDDDDDKDGKKRRRGERDLELNHSHYLMLDDGTYFNYNTEDYRTELCVQVARLRHENDFPTPVVTIVVEGGKETVANMYYDLRADIPIVIIDGSGRVADFFKRWLLYTKEFDVNRNYSEIPYDIDEIDVATRVENVADSKKKSDESSDSKSKVVMHYERRLDNLKNALQQLFSKYYDQLENDLEVLLTHDDDSSKAKEEKKQPGASKNEGKIPSRSLLQVMYCLQPAVRSSIDVFNLNSDDSLSETIFRSICKSRQRYFERKENDQKTVIKHNELREKPQPTSQTKARQSTSRQDVHKKDKRAQQTQLLQLAMDWDCIDVAKELILKNSLDNILNKDKAFLNALTENLPTFVYEFLKLGINPSEVFFPNNAFFEENARYRKFIHRLYTKTKTENNVQSHLSSFIDVEDNPGKTVQSIETLNSVLNTLVGDYMHQLYFHNHHEEINYQSKQGLKDDITTDQQMNHHAIEVRSTAPNEETQMPHDYIMRDLFLWAILMNYIDMAKVFLSHMKYRMCPALIATKILKEYHYVAPYGELKDSYSVSADYFEQYAIECANKCGKNDADKACQLVLQRIPLYGNVTCLQVAADAKDKLFIASPCCVQAMNNIWYDKIHPEQTKIQNEVAMGLGVFSFGLLAPLMVKYREETAPKDEPAQESLESYGINYSDPYPLEYPRYTNILPINQYIHRLENFHQSLRMKYCYHCMAYCFFLLLFSYVLLFAFQRPTNVIPSIDWTEILTIILVSSMLVEEIHYFTSLDNLTFSGKFISYFPNLFKLMNLSGFVLFYIGLILRFTQTNSEDTFTAARVVMAIDLEIWWLRSLTFIIVVPFLGPHLVAIGKMLKDLLFFMCIIAIVMIGYGVASRSMVYYPHPDIFTGTNISTAFDGRDIFRQILYPVYYLMYSQFGNELSNLDEYPNAGWSIATHVLLAIHMLFVNILLTNLLIAMFSKRFDQVYDDTKNIWHSQQYIFTREYYTRSPFFPPISLLYDIYYLSRKTIFFIGRTCFKRPADRRAKVFKMIPTNKEKTKELYQFEGASTYEYAHAEVKASKTAPATSNDGSVSYNMEKSDDANDNNNDSKNSNSDLKSVYDELAKLNQSLEFIKERLKLKEKTE